MPPDNTISMHSDDSFALQARWIIPVDAPPIANGIVEIKQGVITAIHDKKDSYAKHLGDVAIIPGLVNAHTHLELSDLQHPLQPAFPFANWIRSVIGHRQQRTASPYTISQAGHHECSQTGTTTLGDIVSHDFNPSAYKQPGSRVVAFRELIGLLPEQATTQLEQATTFLKCEQLSASANIHSGLSPHAPYSVHRNLVEKLANLAAEHNVPIAMHLAETREELELLKHGSGPLKHLLVELGIWQPDLIPQETRILDYLELLAVAPHVLVVHGNYLDDEEIAFLANHSQFTTIYCPRTHAYFGHQAHPWLQLLEQGAHVAIGTDSRASNSDLNLWKELTFLSRQHPEVAHDLLLKLGTLSSARALGLEKTTGSLTVGKTADLAVVSLAGENLTDPFPALFTEQNSITATMAAGNWVR